MRILSLFLLLLFSVSLFGEEADGLIDGLTKEEYSKLKAAEKLRQLDELMAAEMREAIKRKAAGLPAFPIENTSPPPLHPMLREQIDRTMSKKVHPFGTWVWEDEDEPFVMKIMSSGKGFKATLAGPDWRDAIPATKTDYKTRRIYASFQTPEYLVSYVARVKGGTASGSSTTVDKRGQKAVADFSCRRVTSVENLLGNWELNHFLYCEETKTDYDPKWNLDVSKKGSRVVADFYGEQLSRCTVKSFKESGHYIEMIAKGQYQGKDFGAKFRLFPRGDTFIGDFWMNDDYREVDGVRSKVEKEEPEKAEKPAANPRRDRREPADPQTTQASLR